MIEEPVQKRSGRSIKLNWAVVHRTSSSEKRDMCISSRDAQLRNSMAKSRSETPSSELPEMASKPSSSQVTLAVDRVGGAGQCGSAERHAVDPLAAVGEAFPVALEHFEPGQHMVAEGDRLGGLQVGEAGHDGGCLALGLVQQAGHQSLHFVVDQVDLVAQLQADVGGDLVVAGAAGVQLLAGDADHVGEARFDVHVHIFQLDRPGELASLEFSLVGLQALLDCLQLF